MSIDWATFGVDLHLELDVTAGRRSGLEHALREAIRAGRLARHTRLPSTRALATELNLARNTVAAAYDQLIAEGYLSARTGSGTHVADLPEIRARAVPPVTVASAPRYDLRPGSPDVSTFPTSAWLRATRRALAVAPTSAYGYGDPCGRIELRTALVEYLGRSRGVLATPDRVVITSGYVQALAMLARVLGDPGVGNPARDPVGGPAAGDRAGGRAAGRDPAVIAMEDPGLGMHRDIVRYAGARVVPLPVDERGARTDLLSTPDFRAVRAVVLTPAHQYPIGVTLHPQRRHAATDWARGGAGVRSPGIGGPGTGGSGIGGLIIEDDYDGEFRYDRQPVGALQGMAPEHVVYVGTTSKTLGPALRLAWLVLPQRLVEPVAEAKRHTDLHTETIGQLALADLITSHAYDRHIRACRLRYRRRRDLLIERLGPRSGQRFPVHGIAAGLHAMISLPPDSPTEEQVLTAAAAHGLALGDLGSLWHTRRNDLKGLIVGYGTPTEGRYVAALDTLARVLKSVRP